MKTIATLFVVLAALALSACEMPQQPLTTPAEGASYAPLPARGHGTQDFSRMTDHMEVTPCGYTSMLLYKCKTQ